MWNLCDEGKYKKLCKFKIDKIYTWGDNHEQIKKNIRLKKI